MESHSNKLLKEKNAVVTGSNRGIGKAIITSMAQHGANIWACARSYSEEFEIYLAELASKHHVRVTPVYFDLSDSQQITMGVKTILSDCKDIDIIVNNAGAVLPTKLFTMTKIEEMQKVFQINFFAPLQIIQLISRAMIKRMHGNIINVSSIAALDADHGQVEYVASKAALAAATKKMARELSPYKIRVNAVAPGLTDTDILSNMPDDIKNSTISRNITGRLGTTEEIANVVTFLASDMSSYINGQTIRVDGGY